MAFGDIAKKIVYPPKTSDRFKRLDAFDRLLAGTFYDHIKTPFETEDDGSGYVKIRDRRPSVIWNGAALITKQIAGLMWGDEQMPLVRTYRGEKPSDQDRQAEEGIAHLIEELNLDAVMLDVTEAAATGSCAIVVRALDDKSAYIEVVPGKQIEPKFDPQNPKKLISIDEKYPLKGRELREQGYTIPDDDLGADFWFRLTIDGKEEVRYHPMRSDRYMRLGEADGAGKKIEWEVDQTYPHDFGEINVVWVKAPGKQIGPDGPCLFAEIVDGLVEIDYLLSQIGRGYRYSADPMLVIKRGELAATTRPAGYESTTTEKVDGDRPIVKSADRVLEVEPNGDAKMLEITGQGLKGATDHVKLLREWMLEVIGGMKSDAETTKGVESGRALEMLFQALILVLKRWRIAIGNNAFVPLVRLILTAIEKKLIAIDGLEAIAPSTVLRLVWPAWMTPTGADLLATAQAWETLAGGSAKNPVAVLPREFITRLAASNLGATDPATVVEQVDAQRADDEKKAIEAEQRSADLTVQTAAATAAAKGPTEK